jgi:phospholipase C
MKFTRRKALKGLGAAAVTSPLASCAGRLPQLEVPTGIADRIDTVVVVMMENRSFDHYMGALTLEEGRADVAGLTADIVNARTDGTLVSPHSAIQDCVADPPHGWNSSHRQFNAGLNDGFVLEHERRHGPELADRVMGYWNRDRLSTFYGFADHYSMQQKWFSSVMGPTWPNRYFSLIGTSDGQQENDAAGDYPIVFEHVYNAGKTYGLYFGNIPFAMLSPRMSLDDPSVKYMEDFYEDARTGSLPNLTWIDPLYGRQDDHPPTHPVAGQIFIQSIYNALAQSPQWERTLLIVTYDEHGGFHDHVAPPTTPDDLAAAGFDQLGFRVPSFVVGGYVQPGLVDDVVYDHTSIYRTLAELWDLPPLTTREQAANHFLHVLDEERIKNGDPLAPVELPIITATDEEVFAPECVFDAGSFLINTAGVASPGTGQREAEALINMRFGSHRKNRIADTDNTYRRLLEIARDLGVYETT